MRQAATIKLVVFDAFGTLVEIGEPRRPFRRLLSWAGANNGYGGADVARLLMAPPVDLGHAARLIGVDVAPGVLGDL